MSKFILVFPPLFRWVTSLNLPQKIILHLKRSKSCWQSETVFLLPFIALKLEGSAFWGLVFFVIIISFWDHENSWKGHQSHLGWGPVSFIIRSRSHSLWLSSFWALTSIQSFLCHHYLSVLYLSVSWFVNQFAMKKTHWKTMLDPLMNHQWPQLIEMLFSWLHFPNC